MARGSFGPDRRSGNLKEPGCREAPDPLSNRRGHGAGHFWHNVPGGRRETCQGDGTGTVEMQFLADVGLGYPRLGQPARLRANLGAGLKAPHADTTSQRQPIKTLTSRNCSSQRNCQNGIAGISCRNFITSPSEPGLNAAALRAATGYGTLAYPELLKVAK